MRALFAAAILVFGIAATAPAAGADLVDDPDAASGYAGGIHGVRSADRLRL